MSAFAPERRRATCHAGGPASHRPACSDPRRKSMAKPATKKSVATRRWLLTGAASLAFALPTLGQDPRPGDYYEDKTDLGFKIKMPAKWESVPPAPDDGNLVIKYDPRSSKTVQLGPENRLPISAWVVKFDRRKREKPKDPAERRYVSNHKNVADWVKSNVGPGFKSIADKDYEVDKIPAFESILESKSMVKDEQVRLYTMLYKLHADVDVAVVFIAPGEDKKWNKYINDFRTMARSFRTVEVENSKTELAADATLRDRKRAELQDLVSRQGDWKLYETPNYFIISSLDDKPFIEELKGRLEAIRAIYEEDYPAAKAAEIRAAAASVSTGGNPEGKKGEEKDDPPDQGGTSVKDKPPGDMTAAMEASRCSIVRICKNREQYMSYGGPGGSAGYWSPNARELVLYDDKARGGRNNTWIVLNHEAFHQYIFYFYGSISPHSWYNEGTGDFYSGYAYKNGRFTLKENSWRKEIIKEAIRDEFFIPFKKIFRFSQQEYYSQEEIPGTEYENVSVCYAQGWSMIYFLRTGKKNNAKGWDARWDTLLDDYLKVLAATGKPDQAIEQCLTGIDVDALQAAWATYIK
jgi:hypothetical protein